MVQINKTHTHTHTHQTLGEKKHWKGLVSMKIVIPPFFKNKLPYFTKPCLFIGKFRILFFSEILKTQIAPPLLPPIYKDGGSNYDVLKDCLVKDILCKLIQIFTRL